ncbi:substrate-binding domain-containing protein [Auraticoccus sp. F435]|uniref:Substrate-binding domain-containing protein n=1 Tax=Auraticoccus cholistanensis TaxID=2656650 RepID=A0A6A9USD0_9ACTN|nr:LacI family DNA-binding transcriptional regulator [Auraticoccus cholistanensis]MVA74592.1 substrate-binding domain-containing protein [Auraticoccus cholistanensis]
MELGHVTRLDDVARALGVSTATVSRALSGKAGVSSEVAERVRRTAAEMGYVANVHARTLAGGTTTVIGLVVHEIGDPYFTEIAGGLVEAAEQNDLLVQVCHAGRDPGRELKQVRSLVAHRVRAVVLAGSGHTDPEVDADLRALLDGFTARGGHVVAIGRRHLESDALLPDNTGAGATLARHLLELGHRRIAVLGGPPGLTTVQDRLAGIHSVLDGREDVELHVLETDFTRDGAATAAVEVVERWPRTTAVLALNDAMAIGVLDTLRRRGVRVPEQVSVAGFDDVAVAAQLSPSLTTTRFPLTEMGREALQLVLTPPSGEARRRRVDHQLITRESTAPPPQE